MSTKQKKLLWPFLITLTISSLALLLASERTKTAAPALSRTVVTPKAEEAAVEPPNAPDKEQVQALVITARPGMLEPSEATLPAGKYLLAIENRSGLRDVAFRFDADLESGLRLHDVHDLQRRLNWRQQLELAPGSYRLSEVAHPEMSCRITVTHK